MGRKLTNFKGKNAVVACGDGVHLCNAKLHPKNDYFSINIDPETRPDFVFDITKELPHAYQSAFHITLIEHLDFDAYNKPVEGVPYKKNGETGFENILSMTKDNGFVVIVGCPRLKNFRACVQHLKYIELNLGNYFQEVVLISKNQSVTIEQLNHAIDNDSELKKLLQSLMPTKPIEGFFAFSQVSYDELETVSSEIKKLNEAQNRLDLIQLRMIKDGLANFLKTVKSRYPNHTNIANQFVEKSMGILDAQHSNLPKKIEHIKGLEKHYFKHQYPLIRLLIDVLWIPLAMATLGAGFALKKHVTGSYTFFGEPSKEKLLLNELVPDLCSNSSITPGTTLSLTQ